MKRIKQILTEVSDLNFLEVSNSLQDFLKQEYGLTVVLQNPGNIRGKTNPCLDIYLSNNKHQEGIEDLPDDKISKAILKHYNSLDTDIKALNVFPTEYGYVIILNEDNEDVAEAKLNENTLYYYYYYNDFYNDTEDTAGVNRNMHATRKAITEQTEEERLIELLGDEADEVIEKEVEEELDKEEVEIDRQQQIEDADISNVILDDKFIWFFSITDIDGEVIRGGDGKVLEELESIDEAIDYLVHTDGASMLVAFPYVDPNPEDDNLDLVFADNPGPVIVYNEEGE